MAGGVRLSYQRAHRDYAANADPQATERVVETVKKLQSPQPGERTVFFDEFAVYDRPSLFYGCRTQQPSRSQE